MKRKGNEVFIEFQYDQIDTMFTYLSFNDTIPFLYTNDLNSGEPRPQGIVYYCGVQNIRLNGVKRSVFKFEALSGMHASYMDMYQFKSSFYLDKVNLIPVKIDVKKYSFKTQQVDPMYQNITIINSLKGLDR